ncbi:MAG: hypothetical protein CL928_07980 [Deltaproteobacteria bacterium]|nr:hypothetical protein [Deltaproteobacteria bacterium]
MTQASNDQNSPAPVGVQHEAHSSSLTRRRPSRHEDEARLTGIHNTHAAASIRRTIRTEAVEELHEPTAFSWLQFWKTLLYETLPPVIFSPLAALVLEPSREQALHVVEHRMLLATSTKYRPMGSVIQAWVSYVFVYLIHVALFVALFGDSESVLGVDPFQIGLVYALVFVRNLIIAVKYGYFRPEDIAQLGKPPPEWDEERTNRRLIFAGWRSPGNFPGLIEDELTCAMDENDIALQGMSFRMGEATSSRLRQHPTNELFTAATSCNTEEEVSSGFVAHQLITRAYSVPFPTHYGVLVLLVPLMLAAIPVVTRWQYGLSLFGGGGYSTLVAVAVFLGSILATVPVLVFGLISAHDFNRRAKVLSALGKLVQYPGLAMAQLLGTPGPVDQAPEGSVASHQPSHVFVDLKHADNVFAWMNCRKTLRSFGEAYYHRTQVYTSILLGYAFLCMLVLNAIVWGQMEHHVSTIYLIAMLVLSIATISMVSITKATRLQALSRKHRDVIKREVFLHEKHLLELDATTQKDEVDELQHAKALLQQVDEMIHFQEEIYKPTTVLGQAASQNVVNSTMGVLLAGLFFAVEGFSSALIEYDTLGWFLP